MKEALMATEEPHNAEMVLLNEGVWLKEEEISDMIESLVLSDACLNQNNDIEIIQIHDEEDGTNDVMVQQDEEVQRRNNLFAGHVDCSSTLGKAHWWEAYDLASGGENYTDYNWCFEDDMKMWEWSEYSYTTLEFPRRFEMPGLIECKDASEASAN